MAVQLVFMPVSAIVILVVVALLLIWLGTKNRARRTRAAGEFLLALVFLSIPGILTAASESGRFSVTELWASVLAGIVCGALVMLGLLNLMAKD